MGHVSILLDKMGLDKMGLDEMGINWQTGIAKALAFSSRQTQIHLSQVEIPGLLCLVQERRGHIQVSGRCT